MRLRPYSTYKPSGIDRLGDLPAHWAVKRLKLVARRIDEKVEAEEQNPVPYVGLEHVEPWTGRLLTLDSDFLPIGMSNRFKAGDTLFGKLRPYLAKACNLDFGGLCSSKLLVLRPESLDRRFLLFNVLSRDFISLVDCSTYGAKMPRAGWAFIGVCALPVPPGDEQRTIANFLDAVTADIDTLVGRKRALIERLREKRVAVISHTVTRGLPPDAARAVGLEPHPKLKHSGIDWLGDVPAHWDVRTVRRVSRRVQTGSTPPTADDEHYENGIVPWFGPGSFDD